MSSNYAELTSHPLSSAAAGERVEEGRFIFINNILCKTADDTGSFCPRDVFNSLALVAPVRDMPAKEQQTGFSLPQPPWMCMSGAGGTPSHTVHSANTTEGMSNHYLHATAAGAGASASATAVTMCEEDDDDDDDDVYETDCHVFNTFGILSGGVLIDLRTRRFVDGSDARRFTPALSSCRGTTQDGDDDAEEDEASRSAVVRSNLVAYGAGQTNDIRAESALIFCSSIEPYRHPGTEATPLPPPLHPQLTTSAAVNQAKRNMMHVMTRLYSPCAPNKGKCATRYFYRQYSEDEDEVENRHDGVSACGRTTQRKDRHEQTDCSATNTACTRTTSAAAHARFVHAWSVSETYRLVCRAMDSSTTYLPTRIRFRFRYAGRVRRRKQSLLHSSRAATIWAAELQRRRELAAASTHHFLHAADPHSQSSRDNKTREANVDEEEEEYDSRMEGSSPWDIPAPSFTCYTGRPWMVTGAGGAQSKGLLHRDEVGRIHQVAAALLQPWKPTGLTAAAACEAQPPTKSRLPPDSEAPYLIPLVGTSPYTRAWWVFRNYITYLGILHLTDPARRGGRDGEDGRGGLHRARLVDSSEVLRGVEMSEAPMFTLCPDAQYSVSQEVRRRREDEMHRRRVREASHRSMVANAARKESDVRQPPEQRVPLQIIVLVYDALMQSVPRQLMQRLGRVERYLTKLQRRNQSLRMKYYDR